MGEVIELFRKKTVHPTDIGVDSIVSNELSTDAATNAWLQDFIRDMQDDVALADMHFICTNRALMERVHEAVDCMEAVLPSPAHHMLTYYPLVLARINVFNIPMRELASEVTLSSHVLWLSLPDHYGALVGEYRRRIAAYNRLSDKITQRL